MNILLFTDHTFIPHRAGGRESSINDLAVILTDEGHSVTVLAKKPRLEEASGKKVFFKYRVIESDDPFNLITPIYIADKRVNIIASVDAINFNKFINIFPAGSCLFLRDQQGLEQLNAINMTKFQVIANSKYIAHAASSFINREIEVFPPLINLKNYEVSVIGDHITFINPVPKKGLEIALAVARNLPHINFLFCEAWPIDEGSWGELNIRCQEIGNITLLRRCLDMREIYRETRILMVPSLWEEAWGRVVTESQVSGIPSIVSASGGLIESCGVGGIIIKDKNSIDSWTENVSNLYSNEILYKEKSALAKKQSNAYEKVTERYPQRLVEILNVKKDSIDFDESMYEEIIYRYSQYQSREYIRGIKLISDIRINIFNARLEASKFNSNYKDEYLSILYYYNCYSEIIDFLLDNEQYKWSADSLFILSNSARIVKKWALAANYWEVLYKKNEKGSSDFLIKSMIEALRNSGQIHKGLDILKQYISKYPDKNSGFIFEQLCELLAIIKSSELSFYSEILFRDYGASSNAYRYRILSCIFDNKKYLIQPMAEDYISKYSENFKANSYEELVWFLCEAEAYELAFSTSKLAIEKYPNNYKGPVSPLRFPKEYEITDFVELFTKINSINNLFDMDHRVDYFTERSEQNIICSWPGSLSSNKFMENFRSIFEKKKYKIFPINMPSDGVLKKASMLIIQFPDVIYWRNRKATQSQLLSLMIRELIAVYEWKKFGIKIVWIVHNLKPHDINIEYQKLWDFFYYFLGSMTDVYLSMAPSNQALIQQNIPSLNFKKYEYFFHPEYYVGDFTKEEIGEFRKKIAVADSESLIGILGSIALYKGLSSVIESFKKVENTSVKLLIAGSPKNEDTRLEIEKMVSTDSRIILIAKFLQNDEIDLMARSCDKLIVPNSDYLNSGAIAYSLCANKMVLALNKNYAIDVKRILGAHESALQLVDEFDPRSIRHFIGMQPLEEKISLAPFDVDIMFNVLTNS